MIHLIGLVFSNGTGQLLYNDQLFDDEGQHALIWGLTTAITSFAMINLKTKGSLELIAGKFRLVFHDPFLDLEALPENRYTLVGIQDTFDNMDFCRFKLRKIHDLLIESGLGSPTAFLTLASDITYGTLEKITHIVLTSSVFSSDIEKGIRGTFSTFSSAIRGDIFAIALFLMAIDGGIVSRYISPKLIEDPVFSESVLVNMVAQNPADVETAWVEHAAPKTIIYSMNIQQRSGDPLKEAFTVQNLKGGRSEFCLLVRLIFYQSAKDQATRIVEGLRNQLKGIIH